MKITTLVLMALTVCLASSAFAKTHAARAATLPAKEESVADDELSSTKLVASGTTETPKADPGMEGTINLNPPTQPSAGERDPASVSAPSDAKPQAPQSTNSPMANNEATTPALKKADLNKLLESEIPVFATGKDTKKASGNPLQRLLLTLAVLAIGLGATLFGLKRWSKKQNTSKAANTKIKVLTQHHLGPKKNLTIVQVAGETLLLGVTDHNISILKTLALIDDEVPEMVPQNFGQTLGDFDEEEFAQVASAPRAKNQPKVRAQESSEIEDFAMRGISEIRDTVSSRLKNMRNF